jgi:dihydroorotate dehydrogenase (fumarate)
MANLKTSYLGLELNNPIIVGSSGMSKTVEGVERLAEAGAGAVVLKSLFEEEVRLDYADTTDAFIGYPHPEAAGYLDADVAAHYGPERYLRLVEHAAKSVDVPVIASINCVSGDTWVTFASQLEAAGAAAIELNIYVVPMDAGQTAEQVEKHYVDAVKGVKGKVGIPVAAKLVPYITNLPRLALQLHDAGAGGLVLFNRFYQPDIDVDREEVRGRIILSSPDEYRLSLRWIALLYGRSQCELCASTGVHDGKTVVRQILAGARAVQVTSALYQGGYGKLGEMVGDVERWMDEHGYENLDAFRGKLSRFKLGRSEMFERAQYIKAFVGAE